MSENLPTKRVDVPDLQSTAGRIPDPIPAGLDGFAYQAAAPPGGGAKVYLHAFRRRWAVACFLGLLGGTIAGLVTWFTYPERYTATALLRIASSPEAILFTNAMPGASYEIYRSTQQQYVTSRFVLLAALRQPSVSNLDPVRREPDAAAWLLERLSVRFAGNSELMQISMTAENPEQTAALVNAVVDAYMEEVVAVEHNQRRQRLDELERLYSEKESELRKRRNDLMQLAEQLQTGDSEALSLKERSAVQRFSMYRQELANVQVSILRMQAELKIREAWANESLKIAIADQDLEMFARGDVTHSQLLAQRELIRQRMTELERTARPEIAEKYLSRYREDLTTLQKQIDTRLEELREEMRRRRRLAIEDEISEMKMKLAVLQQQQQELENEVNQARHEAEKLGVRSLDVEMMRAEVRVLEDLLRHIGDERQKLAVELRSPPRITLVQHAQVPVAPDQERKTQLTVLATLAGLAIPIMAVVWWDVRKRPVNTPEDLGISLGLEVLGNIPQVPGRVLRGLEHPSRRHWRWQSVLVESVNGIVARLLRSSEEENTRVILVTSAEGGEGKTTVAGQLAMSLARLGYQTLLVDFDLRKPSIDSLLGVHREPGMIDLFLGKATLEDVLQDSGVDNLSVLCAGKWHPKGLSKLVNGFVGSVFDQLRSRFEYVIIDTSPVLPVADTRFISPHVDGAILTVLRDFSRIPKIVAANEILKAHRVRILGVVVTGGGSDRYFHYRYTYDSPPLIEQE